MLLVVHLLKIKLYDTAGGEGGLSPGDVSGDHTAEQHGQPKPGTAAEPQGSPAWDVPAELFVGRLLPTFSTGGVSEAGNICISFTWTEISEWKLKLLAGRTPWTGFSTWWQGAWQSFILSPLSWLHLRRALAFSEGTWLLSFHGWEHCQHNLGLLHSTSKIWGLLIWEEFARSMHIGGCHNTRIDWMLTAL